VRRSGCCGLVSTVRSPTTPPKTTQEVKKREFRSRDSLFVARILSRDDLAPSGSKPRLSRPLRSRRIAQYPAEQCSGQPHESSIRIAARFLDARLDESECRGREHQPGSEAERDVRQPLRSYSDRQQRQGADHGHQTAGQARQFARDENARPG
jgi:hypothetical protein